jgi:hypothetical protein
LLAIWAVFDYLVCKALTVDELCPLVAEVLRPWEVIEHVNAAQALSSTLPEAKRAIPAKLGLQVIGAL